MSTAHVIGERKPREKCIVGLGQRVSFESNSQQANREEQLFLFKLQCQPTMTRAVLLNCGQYNSKNGTIRMFCDL